MSRIALFAAAGCVVACLGQPAAAGEVRPGPLEIGKWALVQGLPNTDAEWAKACAGALAWVEVTSTSWIDDGPATTRQVCSMPKWKVSGSTYRSAAPLKCKPAIESDGDGDGGVSVVVKGARTAEINNSLFIHCP